jgi:hypothetical protein
MLDAPVSGGEIGAIDGTLTFMVGWRRRGARIGALGAQRDGQARSHRSRSVTRAPGRSARRAIKSCSAAPWPVVAEAIALSRKAASTR